MRMWNHDLLAEIQKIDQEQVPHGLYGLPEILRCGTRVQPLARILGGRLWGNVEHPELEVAKRLGWSVRYAKADTLQFTIPRGLDVVIEIRNHASTKVRRYGDSYQLDKVHGKPRAVESNDIEKWVSKLPGKAKSGFSVELVKMLESLPAEQRGNPKSYGDLLIAYVARKSDFETLLGGGDDPKFLQRYDLSFAREEWKDPHQRNFWTGLFLWTYQTAPTG